MKIFVVRRTDRHELDSVTAFDETDHLGIAANVDLARIEGLQATTFLGTDLADVVESNEHFFSEPPLEGPA